MCMPTRRVHDYRLCKIINYVPNQNIDKKFNYYFNSQIYILIVLLMYLYFLEDYKVLV